MIKSQKDQGNELFKSGKYKEAIKHYQLYVEQSHQDNKNAYFNLSLCYSKLGNHQQSVDAASKAISLDSNYTKCYYRLALENKEIGNRYYQTFINASKFLRLASNQQISERQQMKKLQTYYRNKLFQTSNEVNIYNLKQIIDQSQQLMTQNQLRIEVDKEVGQWLAEWKQNTQDQQAKLLQIRYIMEDIDYDYGLNIAFLYLNQISNKEKKTKIQNQINAIRAQLNRQCIMKEKLIQLQIQESPKKIENQAQEDLFQEDDDQNLFQTDEKIQQKQQPKIFKTNKQTIKQRNLIAENKQSLKFDSVKNELNNTIQTQIPKDSSVLASKTPKQRLQQLLKNKQKLQENFGQKQISLSLKNPKDEKRQKQAKKQEVENKQKTEQKHKNISSCACSNQLNHSHEPMPEAQALQRRKGIVEALKNAFPQHNQQDKIITQGPAKKQQNKQKKQKKQNKQKIQAQNRPKTDQLQDSYSSYCGWLANQKNKFAATYKCVLKILESTSISSIRKGELLVLLKKRVKNFIIIMRSNSQNQQKVLYSLLIKHGIQQYANEITPLFYTP